MSAIKSTIHQLPFFGKHDLNYQPRLAETWEGAMICAWDTGKIHGAQ